MTSQKDRQAGRGVVVIFVIALILSLIFLGYALLLQIGSIGDVVLSELFSLSNTDRTVFIPFTHYALPINIGVLLTIYIYLCPFGIYFFGIEFPKILRKEKKKTLVMISTVIGFLFFGDVWFLWKLLSLIAFHAVGPVLG
jgi:hypothetical protein